MNYRFILLILFILIIPFSLIKDIYLHDREEFRVAKVINILLLLLMLWYASETISSFRLLLTDYSTYRELYFIETGFINANFNFYSKIIHDVLNLVLIPVIYNLNRRNKKYRKVFVQLIPIMFILYSIEFNREYFNLYKEASEDAIEFSVIGYLMLLYNVIRFTILFLIYNSKTFKRFMYLDNLKIKEMYLNTKK